MIDRRRLIHAVFLVALPLVVAIFGLSVWTAAVLVVFALLWRWAISIAGIFAPAKGAPVILDTIMLSHFVEKVRWCLDRLGIDYAENPSGGVLGALFLGRTVPRLRFRSGIVQSSIGNSAEILRFLWGAYATPSAGRAAFLEPTAERLELEKRLDRYGVNLQVWLYYHLLPDRELTLHAWGADSPAVAGWQKALLKLAYPLLAWFIRSSFRINDERFARSVHHIEDLLADIDMRLADGRHSILGGDELNYTDISFAALSGLWLQPDGYGGGKANACRIARNRAPTPMRADIERWIEDFPRAEALAARLYREERIPGTSDSEEGLQ